jgi:hypothetical protein
MVGDYPGRNPQFLVGPLEIKNATVREILNREVALRGNAGWVVQEAPWNMDKDPSYGLWRIIEYDGNHGAKYSNLLQVWTPEQPLSAPLVTLTLLPMRNMLIGSGYLGPVVDEFQPCRIGQCWLRIHG